MNQISIENEKELAKDVSHDPMFKNDSFVRRQAN